MVLLVSVRWQSHAIEAEIEYVLQSAVSIAGERRSKTVKVCTQLVAWVKTQSRLTNFGPL